MIQLFHVSKSYAKNNALKDVNLRIRRGEFVFVTGPSGAGKTTLLRMIFGAERPTDGQILINGINLGRVSRLNLDLLRRRIGFVFQDFKLLNNKTVAQNVSLALEVTGERQAVIRKKTRQVLRALGLSQKEDAYPLQLSGGERQRVAIARAIVNDPLILLADEPTGNLDPEITREMMILFRSINLKGTTLVIATHSMELLRNTAQRIILLNDGRVMRDQIGGSECVSGSTI
jgi:cell division transport system ATP-binding protein